MLIANGADPSVADNAGSTPIAMARLLGFEEAARAMEAGAGKPEPFVFPQFAPTGTSLPVAEQNAAYYAMPILLAQGHPLGRPGGFPANAKKPARQELLRMFGIKTAEDLQAELEALQHFEPRHRDDAADFPPGFPAEKIEPQLKMAAREIHGLCRSGPHDEDAWMQAHVIYLADLGEIAGYLDTAASRALIRNASREIAGKFSSWGEFTESFVLGARYHNGWEAARYQHICNRIIEGGVRWPGEDL